MCTFDFSISKKQVFPRCSLYLIKHQNENVAPGALVGEDKPLTHILHEKVELHHEKTCFLHMRKQRCRSAARLHLCFHYIQEAFHVYLNKFDIGVTHLFFVTLCKS